MTDQSAKKNLFVFPCLLLTILGVTISVYGREILVKGGLRVSGETNDREYMGDNGVVSMTEDLRSLSDDDYNRLRIGPLIDISSVTPRDEITISYHPSFRYDFDTEDQDLDHDLTATMSRYLTRNWQITLSERFLLSDVVEKSTDAQAAHISSQLTDDKGRRTYRTNELSFLFEYTYWEDSLVSFGYNFTILEQEDGDVSSNYQDYDRHEITFGILHRFNTIWQTGLNGSYVQGLYEDDKEVGADSGAISLESDLVEYHLQSTLNATFHDNHPLSLSYNYYTVEYEDSERGNSSIHDVTMGYTWKLSKQASFGLGGGPSYEETEGQDNQWDYNGYLNLKYGFERGSLVFSANTGFDRENFSGTDEDGLQKYYQAQFDGSYELAQDFSLSFYSRYRNEDQEELVAEIAEANEGEMSLEVDNFSRDIWGLGTGLSYSFKRWYAITLNYDYLYQNSEQNYDSYQEHRLVLSLSYEQDLFVW